MPVYTEMQDQASSRRTSDKPSLHGEGYIRNASGMVAIHQFCHIGRHSFVAGGSLVRKDIPPYVKAAREPLSYVGINSVGLRRRGFEADTIKSIQNIYRILFQMKFNNTQAIRYIEAEVEATKERDEILSFIQNSKRGIMKGYFTN